MGGEDGDNVPLVQGDRGGEGKAGPDNPVRRDLSMTHEYIGTVNGEHGVTVVSRGVDLNVHTGIEDVNAVARHCDLSCCQVDH